MQDAMAVLGPIGGMGGIVAGARWWIDRWERLRREERAIDEARRKEDREAAERLGAVLAQTAAAQSRTADSLTSLTEEIRQMQAIISAAAAAKGTSP